MVYKYFIGIDVSKNTLDFSLVTEGKLQSHFQITNTVKEIRQSVRKLLKQHGATMDDALFCMEYTGIYNLPLVNWLQGQKAKVWMESAVQISKRAGIARGKNDKMDSSRIAMYAFTNRHQLRLWQAPRDILRKISALLSQRTRLMKARQKLKTALIEQKQFIDKAVIKSIEKYVNPPVKLLKAQIDAIEKEIVDTIKADENLGRLYKIIMSIDGVGFVTAVYVLVTTNEFTTITEAKKYGCYAGVVPFQYLSGSSFRGKARISSKANKTIKTLLHMSALAAIRVKGELRDYFHRKVAEGKNKMSVLNAIRNKIVLRIFSCVKRGEPYQKNYHSNTSTNLS